MKPFVYLFLFFLSSYLYSQIIDQTLPSIYKEVLPGYQQILNQETNLESKPIEEIKQVPSLQQEKKIDFKKIFEDKTSMNLFILTILVVVFILYRLRR